MAGTTTDYFGSFFAGLDQVLSSNTVQTLTQIVASEQKTASQNTGVLPPAAYSPPAPSSGFLASIPNNVKLGAALVAVVLVVYLVKRK